MSTGKYDFSIAIGGAAGQGIATPGNIVAQMMARRGLHINAYNAYQSIVRGGHIFLTIRARDDFSRSHGDKLDLLLCLNQDTMDRHLGLMVSGTRVLFNSDDINPGTPASGVELCGLPISELTDNSRNRLVQNTVALGAFMHLSGLDFEILEESTRQRFARQGEVVVEENVSVARAGYQYALENFTPFPIPAPLGEKPLAIWTGNDALAMGGAAAGVKFYAAYPMSPSTGVLHWMAKNARDLGIMVRQMEDEIAVANTVIGAAHSGVRSMCATSGGGFALMTEAIGMAGMMEVPAVFINVQRAGPSTGVPTKTEQGDLWQALGASQGDFERVVVAPFNSLDAFNTMPELFNLTDQLQIPGIVLSDLLISEGTSTVDPDLVDVYPEINRGELITESTGSKEYMRYESTESGVSPRALPGLEGHIHIVATDEHDENSLLISDEFTDPHKRRKMVEKRARKIINLENMVPSPSIEGEEDADVTLVGWGSTYNVIKDAIPMLKESGIKVNHLPIKWIVPLHKKTIEELLSKSNKTIIVENNYSGQFARYLRSETGITADGYIRKYDGEPFAPHHIVEAVKEQLAGKTKISVPYQEIMV
ncbi:MAG: 2-oxoacid:acceptor oxidoreductase subunit alpha [Dehalococcoidia bacterium]|nr:2-oxoacid:acceptor oxidoreductase subunit alpha [Dehalococcoidia bacterium]|tara:strand:- start:3852 stop:5633 length:1782 start_codon:yes stop_codon:yes gene_type:complete